MFRLPIVLAFGSMLMARVAGAQVPAGAAVTGPAVVVTNGEGIVSVAPDRAFVVLTTESRARQPRDAQNQNSSMMNAVQDKLRAAGVPKDSVRTVSFNLQQEFDYTGGRPVPRDFVARHAIEVRLDDIQRVGELLDAAVASGATAVSQIRFDLKDRPKAEREALRLAVADARARADAAAAGTGATIDRVIKIEERGAERPGPIPVAMMTRAEQAPTPVAQGELEIRASVTLTASIK